MHIYLYDNYLNHPKYQKDLAQIETRITDLGLGGRIVRISPMNTLSAVLRTEFQKNIKTLVVVGNDKLLNEVINWVYRIKEIDFFARKIPVGYILLDDVKANPLSTFMGLPYGVAGCDILAARKLREIKVIKANGVYFLGKANIDVVNTEFEIDNNYRIKILEPSNIEIEDSKMFLKKHFEENNDNFLSLKIKIEQKNKMFLKKHFENKFNFQNLKITNNENKMFLEKHFELTGDIEITKASSPINLIVSKIM